MALRVSVLRRVRMTAYILFGSMCVVGAGFLGYDVMRQRGAITSAPQYTYTINQAMNSRVEYANNSFYPSGPATDTTAYITELTDKINSTLFYSFKASKTGRLTYTYSVTATVRGTYGVPNSTEDSSSVWAKHFELQRPVSKTIENSQITLNKSVAIPFRQYRKTIEDFRQALALPISSELEVQFHVIVNGLVDGKPFTDTRTTTISAPLNVQIYQLATRIDKTDTKGVSVGSPATNTWRVQLEMFGTALLVTLGIVAILRALHHAARRTPYQRELRKIFRYHDGIIIRTKRPIELSANKTIVQVKTFDDILNVEEETKSPIIASPAGESATRFMIAEGDIIYSYILGEQPIELLEDADIAKLEIAAKRQEPTHHTQTKRKKSTKRKIS